MSKTSYGIIGCGSFGELMLRLLPNDQPIYLSSRRQIDGSDLPAGVRQVELTDLVKQCNVIFLCIPVSAYKTVLESIANILQPETILVDVASVKLVPQKLVSQFLPDHKPVLFTHPMFGPQTIAGRDLTGFKVAVTNDDIDQYTSIIKLFTDLGAEIYQTTADDHDKQMSFTHALTFFISQALVDMQVGDVELTAPSYQKLLDLAELETHHSQDLFSTIQAANPHASYTRQQLIDKLIEIDKSINADNQY